MTINTIDVNINKVIGTVFSAEPAAPPVLSINSVAKNANSANIDKIRSAIRNFFRLSVLNRAHLFQAACSADVHKDAVLKILCSLT